MKSEFATRLEISYATKDIPVSQETNQINQNIEAVLEYYTQEEQKISRSQRMLERIAGFVGQPFFLGLACCLLLFGFV